MIYYKTKKKKIKVIKEIECDYCHKKCKKNKDPFEYQNFYSIDFIGKYDSIFGDGNRIKCDICQDCLKDIIKEEYRVEN